MVVHTPIDAALSVLDFNAAYARVNEWRGQMIENFSRAEQAVTETLVVLNDAKVEVKGAKFPHLTGQRFDRLGAILEDRAASSSQSKLAAAALSQFRTHEELRAMLCHGVTKIALDRSGAWVALMTLAVFKAADVKTMRLTIEEGEAEERLKRLIEDRKRLASQLGQVRREFSALN